MGGMGCRSSMVVCGRWASVRTRRNRRGFTAVELLVLILIVLLLLSIFIPFIRKTRESDHRLRCQSNLRAIGDALTKYAKANASAFPRVVQDAANNPGGYFAYTGPYAPNPFVGDGRVSANDVTASLWLLVRGGYAPPALFICPSTSDWADPVTDANGRAVPAAERSNFKRAGNLSYSYASPFSAAPGYKFNEYLPSDFVLMADKNPGKSGGSDVTGPAFNAPLLELAKANSRNHGRAGQSMLYADMHVEFRQSPYSGFGYYATGAAGDNIYTVLSATPLPDQPTPDVKVRGLVGPEYGPAWKADSYLVPTEDQDRGG
jgi:type II secretory pathway pseudopilin PulG